MSIEYSLAWQEVFNCIKLISAEDFWQQCALICNDKFRITSNQNLVSWIKYELFNFFFGTGKTTFRTVWPYC